MEILKGSPKHGMHRVLCPKPLRLTRKGVIFTDRLITTHELEITNDIGLTWWSQPIKKDMSVRRVPRSLPNKARQCDLSHLWI